LTDILGYNIDDLKLYDEQPLPPAEAERRFLEGLLWEGRDTASLPPELLCPRAPCGRAFGFDRAEASRRCDPAGAVFPATLRHLGEQDRAALAASLRKMLVSRKLLEEYLEQPPPNEAPAPSTGFARFRSGRGRGSRPGGGVAGSGRGGATAATAAARAPPYRLQRLVPAGAGIAMQSRPPLP